MNMQQIETNLFRDINDFVFVTEIHAQPSQDDYEQMLAAAAVHVLDHHGVSWEEFSTWSMEACGGEAWSRLDSKIRKFKAKCDAIPKLI